MVILNGEIIVGAAVCTGVAAFGITEAARSFFPGINRIGFKYIRQMVASLTPEGTGTPLNTLSQADILGSLRANWEAGAEIVEQKTVAKSLVRMHLSPSTATVVASRTNVDPALLGEIATKIASGSELTQQQSDINARFDVIVAALLDEAYRDSDRVYRHGIRTLAAAVAVLIAFAGGWTIDTTWQMFWWKPDMFNALLIGLLATPLPPVAKDISTAVSAAVKKKIQSYL